MWNIIIEYSLMIIISILITIVTVSVLDGVYRDYVYEKYGEHLTPILIEIIEDK